VGRKIFSAVILGAALLAAAGCGGSGNDASVGTDTHRAKTVTPAQDASAPGLQTVTFQGVQFDVPADWAVHDLSADPSQCVRFDVNAVYLGHPGADMDCPAGIVGRADSMLVEPTDGAADTGLARASDVASENANGLEMRVAASDATKEVDAAIPSAGVNITLGYADSDATAQQILHSFRAAGS
jgi:hypothetical protein